MKSSLLLLAIFGISLSVQEGYYHKQYQYKSSSSSFKNNELQHKTDDEEFSSVHGDLAGRQDPKVNAYSQHTEYKNPNAQDGQQTENFGGTQFHGAGGSGRYQTQNLGYGGSPDDVSGSIAGQRKHISYSGTYTVSGGQADQLRGGNYDTQSNLLDLTQKVQNSLSRQLSSAISEQHRSSGHHSMSSSSVGVQNEIQSLEDELRANLTQKLQEELNSQYGSQTRRGSYSYSGSQSRPNYNTQELDDLTQQVQSNLLDQLKREYQTQSSSSSSQSSYSASSAYGSNQKTYNPHQHQPSHQISSNDYTSRAHTPMYRPEAPTVHPSKSLVDVTTIAQTDLDTILNAALSYLKVKYMNDDTYKSIYQPDYDIILNDLTSELKRNISSQVTAALRNAYGYQEEKNGYYFSTWNLSANIANYKTEDLDNLKKQVEKNLLDKLTQEVRNQKRSYAEKRSQYQSTYHSETQTSDSWNRYPSYTPKVRNDNNQYGSQSSQSQYASSSSYGTQYPVNRYPVYPSQSRDDQQQVEDLTSHNLNRYPTNTYSQQHTHGAHRDDQQQQVEEIDYPYKPQTQRTSTYIPSDSGRYQPSGGNTHSSSHSSNSESSYQYTSGNRQSGVQTSQIPTAQISQIQNELNQDLSQQIQRVIQQQRDQGQVYSSSQTNQAAIDDLTEEFKRNFSRRVEEVLKEHGVRGGYSFTITSTGGLLNGQNNDRFSELTSRLQEDLLKQLREGLSRQSYHSSSSSSSSSSTGYQPIRYSSTYGSGDGSSSLSSGSYGGQSAGYGTRTGGYSSNSNYERSGSYAMQSGYRGVDYQQGGECCMQSDEATSPKTIKPPRARADIPVDLEVEPQERIKSTESPKLVSDKVTSTTPEAPQSSTEPQNESKDLTQQTRKLELLTQDISRQIEELTQHQTNDFKNFDQQSSNLYQHTQDFSRLDQQQSFNLPQQRFNSTQQTQNLNQQTQNFGYSSRQESSNLSKKNEGLNQQSEDLTQQRKDLNQQIEDLSQQTQDFRHFDQQETSDLSQKIEDPFQRSEDLTQQTENLDQQSQDYRHFNQQQSYDFGQQTQDLIHQSEDLTQQTEDLTQHTEDLTQQTEDLTQQTEDLLVQKPKPSYQKTSGYSLQSLPNTNNDITKQTDDSPLQKQEITPVPDKAVEKDAVEATITEVEATTEHKGFWKKLGGKISTGLNTVKDKFQSIG